MEETNLSGRTTCTQKKHKKINAFWKKLTTDHLSVLKDYFQEGGGTKQMGRAFSREGSGSGDALQNQDSLDATNSLISSTGFAAGEGTLSGDEGHSLLGVAGGAELGSNVKRTKVGAGKRPRNSMNQDEWIDALTNICGSRKVSDDASKAFELIDAFTGSTGYITWGLFLITTLVT